MKIVFCLVLCLAAILPAVLSDPQNNENYGPMTAARSQQRIQDYDPFMGLSFGTSRRFSTKRNFDEIDAAGFNDFTKRNFDEIDNAGFKDYLRKRNFDEIDAAGFNDFSKRGKPVVGKDKTVDGNRPKGYVKGKRNFDEIDAAGFNDFSKRTNERDDSFSPLKAFLDALRQKLFDDLKPYYDEYNKGKRDYSPNKNHRYSSFDYASQYYAANPHLFRSKARKDDEATSYQPLIFGKYNGMAAHNPPIHSPYYNPSYLVLSSSKYAPQNSDPQSKFRNY